MKFLKKKRFGITLVELLIALGLISTIIGISTNLVLVGNKTHKLTTKEYAMQSDIRIATEKTNEAVRYSKAIFAVPETFVSSTDVMDPGWNYLMATPDGKRIVNMVYDDDLEKHVENVIVAESEDILYYIKFENDSSAENNNVLQYKIYAYNTNKYGQKVNEKLIFESSVDAVNAIQTVDKGSSASPSIALAYRSDGQTSGKGKNQIAYITIIIDISNSMNKTPTEGGTTTSETANSRITKVREALIGNGTASGNGIIQLFSKEENVFISLVPFANTANYPSPHANTNPNAVHPIHEVYQATDASALITSISNMKANGHLYSNQGGTNTGDGLRRAYYLHESFRDRMAAVGSPINEKDQVHHYIIMLIDGISTFDTKIFNFTDNGYYIDAGRNVTKNRTSYKRFDWRTNWSSTSTFNNLPTGNINNTLASSYTPPSASLTENRYYNGTISYKSGRNYNTNSTYRGNIIEYGKKNDNASAILINGSGGETTQNINLIGNYYVDAMGNLIQNFEEGAGINSYIIGYASTLTNSIKNIGDSIGTASKNRYVYNSSNFNLDEIFKNIATDIMADFWLAAGPQIIRD